jgi:hypothetical protein
MKTPILLLPTYNYSIGTLVPIGTLPIFGSLSDAAEAALGYRAYVMSTVLRRFTEPQYNNPNVTSSILCCRVVHLLVDTVVQ